MTESRFIQMLFDVGLRLDKKDASVCFNFFSSSGSVVTRDDFANILTLTDFELDTAVDAMRLRLLLPVLSQGDAAAAFGKPSVGDVTNTNVIIKDRLIKSAATLSQVFRTINSGGDNLLSIDELMDLAGRVEVYFTEEESRKISVLMDVDQNHKVEVLQKTCYVYRSAVDCAATAIDI